MSNFIQVTEGSGKNVATDTVATIDYQQIKLVDGRTGSIVGMVVNGDGSLNASIVGRPSVSGTLNVIQTGTWVSSVVGGPISLYAPSASLVSGVTSIITSTSQTSVLTTAPGAQRNYVTQILVTNAATTATFVDIMDGPNVLYSGYAAANGGGFSATFPAPLKQANTITSLDTKVRTQASVIVAISGFTAS